VWREGQVRLGASGTERHAVLVIAGFVLEGLLALHALQATPVPLLLTDAHGHVLDLIESSANWF
jgi:hypothetical protein